MEQSDQLLYNSSTLKRQEAAIPHGSQQDAIEIEAMRDFIEFLAELKEAQEEEWRRVNFDPKKKVSGERSGAFPGYTYYHYYPLSNYRYHRDYPEGHYEMTTRAIEEPSAGSKKLLCKEEEP